MVKEQHIRRAMSVVRTLTPPEQFRVNRKVDQAIGGGGKVIAEPRPFVLLQSPDNSVWRVRVGNDGVLFTVKES